MYGSPASSRDLNLSFHAGPLKQGKEEADLNRQHQQQMSSGLLRFRSAPSALLGELSDEFLTHRPSSPEGDAVFARFMPPDPRDQIGDKAQAAAPQRSPQLMAAMEHERAEAVHPRSGGFSHSASQMIYHPLQRQQLPSHRSGTVAAAQLEGSYRAAISLAMDNEQVETPASSSGLVRHSSSPAGLFSHLGVDNGNSTILLTGPANLYFPFRNRSLKLCINCRCNPSFALKSSFECLYKPSSLRRRIPDVASLYLLHAIDFGKLSEKTLGENAHPVADGEHPASLENDRVSEAKQSAKEEGISELSPNRVPADSSVERNDEEGAVPTENKKIERKSDGSDDISVHGHTQGRDYDAVAKPLGTAEKVTQNFAPPGPMYGNERGNMQSQARQQVPPSALPAYDAGAPAAHDRAFQPGYADRNMPQFPPHGLVPGDPRGFPPPQMQPNLAQPHAPPYMHDAISQRPPAPDRMLPQHMPHSGPNQDRMFQEPPPRVMMTQGQPLVPNQMRPPSHNFPENLAHQGQLPIIPDPLQAKHPPGNFPAPGANAPLGRGPTSFGPPHGSQLPGQGQIPPQSNVGAIGPRIPHAEPFTGAAPMNARAPPMHFEGQMLRSHPPNPLEAGHYDGRQPDFLRPMPSEHFPPGIQVGNQSNMSAMNGFPGKVPDPSLSQGPIGERFKPLPDERYKSMAEEGLRPPAEDRFRSYGADPGRRIVDRRDFEEDLKQFPRPTDLNSEAGSKFENYLSSSRPHLDRSSHGFDGASRPFDRGFGPEGLPRIGGTSPVPSRLMPGSHVPVGGGGSLHPMDAMERPRSFGLHDDNMGRKGDLPPDFHRPPSDFGRHRIDSLHPLRSPGRELSGLPSSRFGAFPRYEEFNREQHTFNERGKQHNPSPDSIGLHDKILHGSGILPSHLRRGENDTLRIGDLPGHMRGGNLDGHDIMPSHMRGDDPLASGSFRSHLRLGELSGLENVPPHLRSRDFARFGEPGFGSSFPMHGFANEAGGFGSGSFQGGLDPLDHPRKRKPGSIGWCRICKIDCETVEGLDLHSQTKEHQKMAMDIVLSIKQDNAKKHKLSSEENEDSNKSRKTGFEGRPSRR